MLYHLGVPRGGVANNRVMLQSIKYLFIPRQQLFSVFLMAASITCYVISAEAERVGPVASQPHFSAVLGLQLNMSSVHIILAVLIIVALLWMLFSILLVVGLMKNQPSMVLAYFAFGIIITILAMLSGLLVLLQEWWIMAIVLFISSLIHVHYLVVVHTVYDFMQRGKDFRFHQHRDEDEDPLAECFDQDMERI